MDARAIVGQNIRRVRLMRGLSQTELSKDIQAIEDGMSQAYISQLENGQKNISIDKLAMIAKTLGVKLNEFFVEE